MSKLVQMYVIQEIVSILTTSETKISSSFVINNCIRYSSVIFYLSMPPSHIGPMFGHKQPSVNPIPLIDTPFVVHLCLFSDKLENTNILLSNRP